MRDLRRVFRLSLLRPRDVDRDVDEEIAFHLAMREARLRAQGLPDAEAARLARARFGDVDDIRDACRDESHPLRRRERAMQMLDGIRRDVHFAVRSLARARGFTAAIVLTLALGLGANATMWALVDAVVLAPVSGVRDAGRLFELGDVVSHPVYREVAARTTAGVAAPGLAAGSERRVAIGHGERADHVVGALVSGSFFAVVGAGAHIGRTLGPADDAPGAGPVAVLSHEHWTRAFGADPAVLGRTISVNGAPVTVVGVAARDFRGLHLADVPAVWLPIHAWPAVAPSTQRAATLEDRGWDWLRVVGRLAPGATLAGARAALEPSLAGALREGTSAEAIAQTAALRPTQAAALPGSARDGVVTFAAVLAGVVALVLLTACANIAGLMLSRAAYREREIGVRIALGAGRGRLVRQLLVEALVLAAAGTLAGLAVFAAAREALWRIEIPGGIAGSALRLAFDARLFWFSLALAAASALLFGLVPALQASRPDTVAALKGGAPRGGRPQHRLRGALVTAQVAVALVLLVGTGLFLRALSRALAVDLGFRPEGLVTLTLDPGLVQFDRPRSVAHFMAVAAKVAELPGVRGVTWTSNPPLDGGMDREAAQVDGYTPAPDERVRLELSAVGPRYHETVGIPLVSGRGFDERDGPDAEPVVILNETAARRWFAGRAAVGSYLTMRKKRIRIVGVARDAIYHEIGEPPRPYGYFPLLQRSGGGGGAPTLVARVARDARAALPAVVAAARSADPTVPVFDTYTMTDRLHARLAPQVAGAWLLAVFGGLALVVAAVGIYGAVAYAVSQRTREIGIRMALGAADGAVLRLVVGRSLGFVLIGIPLGAAAAVALGRGASRFLFGIGAADPLTLATVSAVMLLAGLVAAVVPARRAVRIDPVAALRAD